MRKTLVPNQTEYCLNEFKCADVRSRWKQNAANVDCTCCRANGVVRGRAAVWQRFPPLTSLPAVNCCIQGRVFPSAHSCILKVTPEIFTTVSLSGKKTQVHNQTQPNFPTNGTNLLMWHLKDWLTGKNSWCSLYILYVDSSRGMWSKDCKTPQYSILNILKINSPQSFSSLQSDAWHTKLHFSRFCLEEPKTVK